MTAPPKQPFAHSLVQRAEYTTRGPVPDAVIRCVDFTLPPLAEGQVRIEVLASPINPSDVLTLTGQYGQLPPLPAIGGNEGVGRVVEHGPGVTQPAIGQTVLLPVGSGTWSSHIDAVAAKLVPLPNGIDPVQLSMLVVNPPTASLLLSEFVALSPGDWVIQNAANSAVGGYLRAIAASKGVKVVNVVRRESAAAAIDGPGADVILVDGPDLAKRVSAATERGNVRLAIDAVGGSATERLAMSVAVGGTVVNYGGMSGEPCMISPGAFVFRDVTLKGFWLVHWFRTHTPAEHAALFGDLARRIGNGELRARVQATYPLSQITDAVRAAAAGERDGKIVVVPARP